MSIDTNESGDQSPPAPHPWAVPRVIPRRAPPASVPEPGKQSPPAPQIGTPAVPEGADMANVPEVEAVIRAIGFIFYNTLNARWFSASDRRQTIREGLSILTTVLEKHDRLRFTLSENEIKVNGDPYEVKTEHIEALVEHLSVLGSCNFTFAKGVEQEELSKFIEFISQPSADLLALGDFTDAVTRQDFRHISSKKIVLREVSDEEVVVTKEVLESVAEEEKKKIESDVLSLLSAEQPEVDKEKSSSLRKTVQDSGRMADLIIQTVAKKQGDAAAIDKQEVSRVVIECLDRAFAALVDDPFSKTQKGKKLIAGALQRLEAELLAKMDLDPGQEESKTVTSAVERMTERLKMDSIVQDYTRKMKALESSEKRILRFIKIQGLDKVKDPELEKKLGEEGVDVSAWHKLLAMTGAEDGDDTNAAVTQLGELLTRLDKNIAELPETSGAETQEQIAGELKEVNTEVGVLTQRTQTKIDGLVEAVEADMAAVEAIEQEAAKKGQRLKLSRKKMLVVLGEVVQELCQPLSVIRCSVHMLASRSLGEVSPVQTEMLQLVSESADKIKTLISNLERIAGPPTTLEPDKQIQQTLNQPLDPTA